MKSTKGLWMINLLAAAAVAISVSACDDDPEGTAAANAGEDQKVLIGDTVNLDGSGSTVVGNIIWTLESKPDGSSAALTGGSEIATSFVADAAGTYVLKLSLHDAESTDTVSVTAKTILAVITNGSGSTITTRTRFGTDELAIDLEDAGGILSGENSRGSVVNYSWQQVSGPFATATAGSTSSTLPFTAPALKDFLTVGLREAEENAAHGGQSDEYKWQPLPVSIEDTKLYFRLTVDDGAGNSDSTTQVVYVQDAGAEIQRSSGLWTVPLNVPLYLQGPNSSVILEYTSTSTACNGSLPSTSTPTTRRAKPINDDWSWTLTPPDGSAAVFADSGTVASALQLPKFTPDVEGYYTVAYTATVDESAVGPDADGVRACGRVAPNCKYTSDGGVDHCTIVGSFRMYAGTYVGIGSITGDAARPECAGCHDGSAMPDKVGEWQGTNHSKLYENSYLAMSSLAPEPYLWGFETVGYNTSAANGGFDEAVASTGFDVSTQPGTYADFLADAPSVAALSGVQCENCHGPGSGHNGDATKIGVSASQTGICGQCHTQEAEWINSSHNMTGVSHGSASYQVSWLTNAACTRCHTSKGFINYVEGGEEALTPITEQEAFVGIGCAGCHDPHDATNEDQLRMHGELEMIIDESTVDAGKAAVCYKCHDGLYSFGEFSCDTNRDGVSDTLCETLEQNADYYTRQVHYNPQAPVLEGKGALLDLDKNGIDDVFTTGNSFHSEPGFILADVSGDPTLPTENRKCLTCHMAEGPDATEDGFRHLGGHSFNIMSGHGVGHLVGAEEEETVAGEAGELANISACTPCHTDLTEINREARGDYDGDGTIEGIQDEVTGLALLLSDAIKAYDDVNLGTCSVTTLDAGDCNANKKCTLAPYISCTAAGDTSCDAVKTCSAASTTIVADAQFCTSDAGCNLKKVNVTTVSATNYGPCGTITAGKCDQRSAYSCSKDEDCKIATTGTMYFGPCVTATNKCTIAKPRSTAGSTDEIECSTDNDCIVPDALGYSNFNGAGADARPCNTSGSSKNRCKEDTTISCGTVDPLDPTPTHDKCLSTCGAYIAGKCDNDLTTACTNAADCNPGVSVYPAGGAFKWARSDKIRRAIWNHNLVVRDGSMGVHNAGYEVGVLQGTYKVITGVAVPNATLR
ncbi:MAG TPA: cytochrome c3 family protein [Bdellovibrionota bacterium]|nr:cytochrome c3 family protein [Bdellovibrionota bacterium]